MGLTELNDNVNILPILDASGLEPGCSYQDLSGSVLPSPFTAPGELSQSSKQETEMENRAHILVYA